MKTKQNTRKQIARKCDPLGMFKVTSDAPSEDSAGGHAIKSVKGAGSTNGGNGVCFLHRERGWGGGHSSRPGTRAEF